MDAHTSSRTAYFITFILLMLLLAATVFAAEIHLGPWALLIALAIAATKIALIGLIFMHLREEPPLIQFFAATGLFWFAILFVLVGCDYLTRNAIL